MKVLGLSFGKKNANTDILVKEALYGAKAAVPDAEIKFINTQRLTIDRCIGDVYKRQRQDGCEQFPFMFSLVLS